MRKNSKTFKEKVKNIDLLKLYLPQEALQLAKDNSYETFDAAMELHIRTGIDPRKSDQSVRGSLVLPHGTGAKKRIAVFAEGLKATEAKDAGADVIGGKELIDEIKTSGKADFDVAIATPDMMKLMASVARVLGPRGLMPSPKNDTVTQNIKQAVDEQKKGKITYKNDDTGNVHVILGKRSFTIEQLVENFTAFLDSFRKNRPSSAKGVFIKTASISTTMGPGIKIQIS